MPRHPRTQFAGALIHVWARRVDRWPLFVDDDDYRKYFKLLAATVERFGLVLLSFCLMPNHVHLLVELRDPNLDKAMRHLHGRYVQWFNARHAREGRLFERRYQSKVVADEVYFTTLVRYIEMNPVDAGLCDEPAGWRWSSRGVVAADGCPTWLADDELRRRRET